MSSVERSNSIELDPPLEVTLPGSIVMDLLNLTNGLMQIDGVVEGIESAKAQRIAKSLSERLTSATYGMDLVPTRHLSLIDDVQRVIERSREPQTVIISTRLTGEEVNFLNGLLRPTRDAYEENSQKFEELLNSGNSHTIEELDKYVEEKFGMTPTFDGGEYEERQFVEEAIEEKQHLDESHEYFCEFNTPIFTILNLAYMEAGGQPNKQFEEFYLKRFQKQ